MHDVTARHMNAQAVYVRQQGRRYCNRVCRPEPAAEQSSSHSSESAAAGVYRGSWDAVRADGVAAAADAV